MVSNRTEALDPRLRRIVSSFDDRARLERDLDQSVLETTESFETGDPVTPSVLTTRTLVKTGPQPPTSELPEATWTRIVDSIYAVTLPIGSLPALAELPGVEFVEAPRALYPQLDTSLPETRADRLHQPPTDLTGDGVVVGIIDFGLDYTLDDFIAVDGSTRVAFLWDQALQPVAGEHVPAEFGYGVEYDADDIDAALAAPNPFAVVRHRPDAASHGTHVAGIAAGNGRAGDAQFPAGTFVGAAPEATIVFVQPHAVDAQTTFTDSTRVAEAMSYVFARARDLGLPCVVNMSLGQNGGSHDGESIVERAIDRLLEEPGRAFVLAAGNEHLWRGHASGCVDAADTTTLQWRAGGQLPLPDGTVLPAGGGDRTPNEMEIWYSPRDQFGLRVTAPGGADSTAMVAPGETVIHSFTNGNQAFIDSERLSRLNGDARIYLEVSPGLAPRVQEGIWQVELLPLEIRDGHFDAWIERDARDRDNAFADQSFFVGVDFDGRMTLGTPATTRRGLAIANYNHTVVAPNDSSSRGRTRDGRDKPEVAAPGTNIVASAALGGRPGPGGPLPVRVRKTGTSMSAPHVTGIIALLLQRRADLSAPQIRGALIGSASPPVGVEPFDLAWGYGRVDAEAALAVVDQLP
ncbi:MAG: S8 family peptidase [Actinobacteria bacterium]|nr:S8 family peptidase [Actinomycetota bacterium]